MIVINTLSILTHHWVLNLSVDQKAYFGAFCRFLDVTRTCNTKDLN